MGDVVALPWLSVAAVSVLVLSPYERDACVAGGDCIVTNVGAALFMVTDLVKQMTVCLDAA